MLKLTTLDLRTKMKRASWSIGTRTKTLYFTLHYNGPKVAAFGNPLGEIAQLQFDSSYHMRKDVLRADGIQYHGATLSDGRNVQLRDWKSILWHCGNAVGNSYSIAWHIPIGGTQRATLAQLDSLFNIVIPAFQRAYNIHYSNVKGHMEWKSTLCPGTLMPYLRSWRSDQGSGVLWYQTTHEVNVREAPTTQSPIALGGKAVVKPLTTFAVDKLVEGETVKNVDTWLHRQDGLGFMSAAYAVRL